MTERKKKKKKKNEAEFIPRELPSESSSNKRKTFDTNIFCHCSMPESPLLLRRRHNVDLHLKIISLEFQ